MLRQRGYLILICTTNHTTTHDVHGQSKRTRQTSQVDSQHSQNHADDGVDRDGAFKKGNGPGVGGDRLHRSDHAVGFGPDQDGAGSQSSVAGTTRRDQQRHVARAYCESWIVRWFQWQSDSSWPNALERIARRSAQLPTRNLLASVASAASSFAVTTHMRNSPISKTSHRSTRWTPSRVGSSTITSPDSSTGWMWSTCNSTVVARQEVAVETLLPLGSLTAKAACSRRRLRRRVTVRICSFAREHPRRSRADQLQS